VKHPLTSFTYLARRTDLPHESTIGENSLACRRPASMPTDRGGNGIKINYMRFTVLRPTLISDDVILSDVHTSFALPCDANGRRGHRVQRLMAEHGDDAKLTDLGCPI
jgi:hypothetical protein